MRHITRVSTAICALVFVIGCRGSVGPAGAYEEDVDPDNPEGLMDAPLGGDPDLVGFPVGYAEQHGLYATVDKDGKAQVREVYANDVALGSKGLQLDVGSVLTMAIYGALTDSAGELVRDEQDRLQKGALKSVFVMEKGEDFGAYTEETNNGRWEYAAYNAKAEPQLPELDCFGCHGEMAGPESDYVFTLEELRRWRTSPAPIGGDSMLARFPSDYTRYREVSWVDKRDKGQVRRILANARAVASAQEGPLERGSILAMEIYAAQTDDDGELLEDEAGDLVPGALNIVAVMEKQPGYGNYTDDSRNDEWEYAFYTPEGVAIESEADCFACHKENAGPTVDYVFSYSRLSLLR